MVLVAARAVLRPGFGLALRLALAPRRLRRSPGSACSTTSTSSRCPSFAEFGGGRPEARNERHQRARPAGAVVVPLGRRRHGRLRHAHHRRHEGLLRQDFVKNARRRLDLRSGCSSASIMFLNVWVRDLAQPEDRASPTRPTCSTGGQADPARGGRRPPGASWPAARTPSSRSAMLWFMVVRPRSTAPLFGNDLEQRQGRRSYWIITLDHHRRARGQRPGLCSRGSSQPNKGQRADDGGVLDVIGPSGVRDHLGHRRIVLAPCGRAESRRRGDHRCTSRCTSSLGR